MIFTVRILVWEHDKNLMVLWNLKKVCSFDLFIIQASVYTLAAGYKENPYKFYDYSSP
jgi:hypothetical protein